MNKQILWSSPRELSYASNVEQDILSHVLGGQNPPGASVAGGAEATPRATTDTGDLLSKRIDTGIKRPATIATEIDLVAPLGSSPVTKGWLDRQR